MIGCKPAGEPAARVRRIHQKIRAQGSVFIQHAVEALRGFRSGIFGVLQRDEVMNVDQGAHVQRILQEGQQPRHGGQAGVRAA